MVNKQTYELKLSSLKNAFSRLKEALALIKEAPNSDIIRDGLIQRFEFTVELLWKTLKEYLYLEKGIETRSPKDVIREARNINLINLEECEHGLAMIDDRNELSHLYKEDIARTIGLRIPSYSDLIENIIDRVQSL
jgi:nucleotidyltransferase substrate binding protein (TIGR01987 family)